VIRFRDISAPLIGTIIACTAFTADETRSEAIELAEAALASESFAEREAAMERLIDDVSLSESDLIELCMRSSSPEVRRRALTIHRQRFFDSSRPAIGVTFATAGGLPMIERVHEGFPAAMDDSLQPGDIIVAVAGQRLNPTPTLARDELRPLIFSHNPFETVSLVVYRPQNDEARERLLAELGGVNAAPNLEFSLSECPDGYDTIESEVQLGEWSMLNTNEPMREVDRLRAWNALLQRVGFDPAPETIVGDTTEPRNVAFHGRRIQSLEIRFPFMNRGAYFPPDENPAGFRNQAVVAKQMHNMAMQRAQVRGPGIVVGGAGGEGGVTVESVRTADDSSTTPNADAMSSAAREIASTQSRIHELSRIASEPGTPAAERRIVEESIAQLRKKLQELRQRIEATAS
jgi:hypothetical protein